MFKSVLIQYLLKINQNYVTIAKFGILCYKLPMLTGNMLRMRRGSFSRPLPLVFLSFSFLESFLTSFFLLPLFFFTSTLLSSLLSFDKVQLRLNTVAWFWKSTCTKYIQNVPTMVKLNPACEKAITKKNRKDILTRGQTQQHFGKLYKRNQRWKKPILKYLLNIFRNM